MKKRFTPLAALCSAMLLSSGMYAMETDTIVPEETTSHKVICKAFSERLKIFMPLLKQLNSKIEAYQTDEELELTKEEQDRKDKITFIKDKATAQITHITSVRTNIKKISPDSWGEWLTKQLNSNKVEAGQEEENILAIAAALFQAIKLTADEFTENHLSAIKESSDKKEAVQSIEDDLGKICANSTEVIDVAASQDAITVTNLFMSILSFLQK